VVSLLVGELVGGDFVSWPEPGSFWREQESGGIRRNPEESGENAWIPVPQEFLRKIPVMAYKNRNSCNLSKTTFMWKIPPENTRKKILRNPGRNVFYVQKINFWKQE
jgi:hypothetical protein